MILLGYNTLATCKYALYCRDYNDKDDCIWENSAIRKWLNTTFFKKAFSDDEKEKILTETIPADRNPSYNTSAGNDTKDKIFLLSINEVEKYLEYYKDRKCSPTSYAKSLQEWLPMDVGCCPWWLRTPGENSKSAAYVNSDGSIFERGGYVQYVDYAAIRPAMWIDVNG